MKKHFIGILTVANWFALFVLFLTVSEYDDFVQGGGDHMEYQSIAVNLIEGHGFMVAGGILPYESYHFRTNNTQPYAVSEKDFTQKQGRSFYRAPVYPLFVASVYAVFGVRPVMIKQIQLLLFCLGASLLIPIGFIVVGKSGAFSGAISSWLFVASFYEICGKLYAESLLTFIASVLLLLWILFLKKPRLLHAILLGLIIGVSILAKGIFYFCGLFMLLSLSVTLFRSYSAQGGKLLVWIISAVLLVTLPYLVWQNYVNETGSQWIFVSQDGETALLGGNNEFTIDGNWIHVDSKWTGFYSTLPYETSPIIKVISYYQTFPSQLIPSLFCKLRNALLRPAAVSLLVYASILNLLFLLFKQTAIRSGLFIGFFIFCTLNLLSNNLLHYRFIDRTPFFFIPLIGLFFIGLFFFFRREKESLLYRGVLPFLFSLITITIVFYGHHRIVMPFYLASILLATYMLFALATQILHSNSAKLFLSNIMSKSPKHKLYYLILVILPFIIPYTIVEIYLRVDGGLDTYAEKTGNSYRSYYNQEPKSIYWSHPINTVYTIDQGDFTYDYDTNEIGLRERRNAISDPDTSVFRILTLGDSFTEGFGAPPDSAWPRVLESSEIKIDLTNGRKIQVYNAGMAGSDPFFNFVMLRDKLLGFKPDLVIQTVNTSDLTDYLFRGGMERFKNGKTVFRKGPWWEVLYRFSYTFRLVSHSVFNYDFMLIDNSARLQLYDKAISDYLSLFSEQFAEMAADHDFSIAYVIQPMPSDLRFVGDEYKRLIKLDSLLKEQGLQSFEILKPMKARIGQDTTFHYSWEVDGHYNSKGYWEMGKIIADSVEQLIPTPSEADSGAQD